MGVVGEASVGGEFGDVGLGAPADEDVVVGEDLDVALAVGEEAVGVLVGVLELGGAVGFVEVEDEGAADLVAVVEEGEGAVGLAAGVVLPGEAGVGGDREVGVFAAQAPDDLAGVAVDLVDGVGVAAGDEQVVVVVDGDRVEVDVVPVLADGPVGLADRDVVEAAIRAGRVRWRGRPLGRSRPGWCRRGRRRPRTGPRGPRCRSSTAPSRDPSTGTHANHHDDRYRRAPVRAAGTRCRRSRSGRRRDRAAPAPPTMSAPARRGRSARAGRWSRAPPAAAPRPACRARRRSRHPPAPATARCTARTSGVHR